MTESRGVTENPSTFGAWLDARSQSAPAELRARLNDVIPLHIRDTSIAGALEHLPAVAGQYLSRIVVNGCVARESALDLLVLDSLVTYLLEAGASIGVDTDAWALRIMNQLAGVRVSPESA